MPSTKVNNTRYNDVGAKVDKLNIDILDTHAEQSHDGTFKIHYRHPKALAKISVESNGSQETHLLDNHHRKLPAINGMRWQLEHIIAGSFATNDKGFPNGQNQGLVP